MGATDTLMVFDKLTWRCVGGATDAINRVPTPLYGPLKRAPRTRNRVPTPLYGPLKRAQDAIAVLLARLGF